MSLIKIRKSNGLKFDPCGTPEDNTFHWELTKDIVQESELVYGWNKA